jgi:hypothetical protein
LRRCDDAGGGANRTADQCSGERALAAAGSRANRGAASRADQRTTRGPLAGIIGIRAGGHRQCKTKRCCALKTSTYHGKIPSEAIEVLRREDSNDGNTPV